MGNGADVVAAYMASLGNDDKSWDDWNAVKHAVWAAYLYYLWGDGDAQRLLWAHEWDTSNLTETQMDYANDFYGLQIARATDELDVSVGEKFEIAKQLILEAREAGQLCSLTARVGDDGVFVDPGRCGA